MNPGDIEDPHNNSENDKVNKKKNLWKFCKLFNKVRYFQIKFSSATTFFLLKTARW